MVHRLSSASSSSRSCIKIFLVMAILAHVPAKESAVVTSLDSVEGHAFREASRTIEQMIARRSLASIAREAAQAYVAKVEANPHLVPLNTTEKKQLLNILLALDGHVLRSMYLSTYGDQHKLASRVAELMKVMIAKDVGIERYKQRILKEIGDQVTVNVNEQEAERIAASIPSQLIQRVEKMVARETREEKEEMTPTLDMNMSPNKDLVILGIQKSDSDCVATSFASCYQFNLEEESLRDYKILRASLQLEAERGPSWAKNKTLEVMPMTPNGKSWIIGRELTKPGGLHMGNSAVHLDVTQLVKRWISYQRYYAGLGLNDLSPKKWQQLLIKCSDCHRDEAAVGSPLMKTLMIEIYLRRDYKSQIERRQRHQQMQDATGNQQRPRRTRRNTFIQREMNNEGDCPAYDMGHLLKCCRRKYETSFRDIGFHFILAPQKFNLNFCDGNCAGLTLPTRTHTIMMQMILERNEDIPHSKRAAMRPCCAPVTLASKTMLFETLGGGVEMRKISNIGVVKCGCQ